MIIGVPGFRILVVAKLDKFTLGLGSRVAQSYFKASATLKSAKTP